jgi:hypothetical protein
MGSSVPLKRFNAPHRAQVRHFISAGSLHPSVGVHTGGTFPTPAPVATALWCLGFCAPQMGWLNPSALVNATSGPVTITSSSVLGSGDEGVAVVAVVRRLVTYYVSLRTRPAEASNYDSTINDGWDNLVYVHRFRCVCVCVCGPLIGFCRRRVWSGVWGTLF